MGLFKAKLIRSQQEEVLKFAGRFYSICSPCLKAFTEFQSGTSQLYHICIEALQQDTEPEGVSTLIEATRAACEQYAQFLASTHNKYTTLKPPAKWYPKKIRKAYDSWGVCLSGEMKFLQGVIGALQPPKPLAHEPRIGNDKLNMFVGGLNYLSFFEIRLRQLPLYDFRSTELLLGIDLSFEEEKRIMEESSGNSS
jgi:hypothetical protein